MAADLTAYNDALKQTWTSDKIETQFYKGTPLLEKIEKTSRYHVGKEALTPLELYRTGGYSAVPSTGSAALNAASSVGIDQASWGYTHHHAQVKVEGSAIDQTNNSAVAVANVIDTEMRSATSLVKKQLSRQLFGNGDALIAKCTTTSSSATILLDPTDYGYDGIVRHWLHPGLTVDIGTTASEGTIAADRVITAVTRSSTAPSITISGATVSTTSSHFVSIANARAGTTSYEMNGLRNVISDSATLGTVTVAAQPDWAAAANDSTTTSLTLSSLLDKQEAVQQTSGEFVDTCVTSYRQQRRFYDLLQMQTRFAGDGNLGAGGTDSSKWANLSVEAHVDCPNRIWAFVNVADLLIVKNKDPYWQNEITGGDPLTWIQGTTAFGGMLTYRMQLACKRRNTHAIYTALT